MGGLSGRARLVLAGPIVIMMVVFFVLPLILMLRYSFASSENLNLDLVWTLDNYRYFFSTTVYWWLLLKSLGIAALVSAICIVIGLPAAWVMARAPERRRNLYLILLVLPWWASYIVRAFGWFTLFGNSGLINKVLLWSGLVEEPLAALGFGVGAVIVAEVNLFLPIMILPIYMSIERLDWSMVDAARSLGASFAYAFRRVVLPFCAPGLVAGTILVFMPVAGSFVVPGLVGGQGGMMIGRVISSQFGAAVNWALGATVSIILLVVLLACLALLARLQGRLSAGIN